MPVIPTLFINQPEITTPQDTVAYLLKFMIMNPGWTSSQIEASLLSMRKFISNNTENMFVLPGAIQSVLDAAIKRYYPDYSAVVTGKHKYDTYYNLEISVTDSLGTVILTTNDFVVENGKFKLLSEVRDTANKMVRQ